MKKNILSLIFIVMLSATALSQEFSYGLKGGINYAMGGEIRGYDSTLNYWDGTAQGEGGIGYHGGVFVQVNFGNFFIRPEVAYASLVNEFDIPLREETTEQSVERFSVPVLLGYNIYGPLDVYAGPVYSNIMGSTIYGAEEDPTIVVQNTPINAQIGAKVEFGRFGLDVRYEHSLSTAEQQDFDFDNSLFGGREGGANRASFLDARLNQVIVSVIFKIGGPGLNDGRRRRPCY